jgi:Rieske Fe-S protein
MHHTPTRRQFLEIIAVAVAAGLAQTLEGCSDTLRGSFGPAVPTGTGVGTGGTAAPVGQRKVASFSELSATPKAFAIDTGDGGDSVYVYTQGDTAIVLSNVCTHKGCAVKWEPGQSNFVCPCHAGTFDLQGRVVSGPPLAPLRSYPAKTTAGVVYI